MKSLLLLLFLCAGFLFLALDPLHFFRDIVCHIAAVVIVMLCGIGEYVRNLVRHEGTLPPPPSEEEEDGGIEIDD